MRHRNVLHIISVVLLFVAAAMIPALAVALIDQSDDMIPLAISLCATTALGVFGFFTTRADSEGRRLSHRDAYLVGVLGWVAAAVAGALPFYFHAHLLTVDPEWVPDAAGTERSVCALPEDILHPGREFCAFTDCMFESVSGITTTGASVIRAGLWDDLESRRSQGKPGLPRGLLLWRSIIQWLGGMGILVLAVTVLSLVGIGGMQLMKAEVPGPTPGRLSPRIADTARILWKVYALISAAEVAMLMFGGMDLYNAVCHTCTTMATGGFSTLAASVGGVESPYIHWVFTFFMLAAGINFTLHYLLIFKGTFVYLKDPEFRVYGLFFLGSVLLCTTFLITAGLDEGVEGTLRAAAFQTASIITTTGYATRDFGQWPVVLQLLLLMLMFIGGCAGSTGGGVKVVRITVLAKAAYRELLRIAHPRAISPVRVGRQVVGEPVVQAISGVVIFFVGTFVVSTLIMAAMGLDALTASSSVAACIGNIGPGLAKVGPAENYFFVPQAGKWVLMFNMLAGRLEIYTVLVLFSPHFWRR